MSKSITDKISITGKITVFTDGGSRGNPGPAAIGIVIQGTADATPHTYRQTIGTRTNNEAEYEAVIFALKKLKSLYGKNIASSVPIDLYSDSKLMINQLNHKYKIQTDTIVPLFMQIHNLRIDIANPNLTFHYIPREQNKMADKLVNRALDEVN